MAPKKAGGAQDKNKQKAKEKTMEDKTFGLKNKGKSAKVQKYVEQLQKMAQPKTTTDPRKEKKRAEEARQKELADIFAMSIKQPKVPPGVDPKSIVCEYFRHNQCTKGFKCKFSHDLSVERKTAKADLFQDRRDGEDEDGEGGMEEWDQEMLEKAIAQKHAADNRNQPTAIICKFFLDAVERKQYGWFWQCPNGKDCKYRHALPPGYVLKSQMKELLDLEAANRVSVEEAIEEERGKVDAKTPVTEASFAVWIKAKEAAKRQASESAEADRKKRGYATGREIFLEEGFEAQDDQGASDTIERDGAEEEAIQRMEQEALEAVQRAQTGNVAQPSSTGAAAGAAAGAGGGAAPGAGGQQAAGSSGGGVATTLHLSAQEEEELFDDDDDDDDEDDEGMLDELEADLQSKAAL